ncbi:MAG: biotin transporter BioY [Anaerolineae bacterium]
MQSTAESRRTVRSLLMVLRIVMFAALIALSAKLTINLPGTPVPITLQPFMILLAGLSLGSREGALSVLTYLGAIAVGLPLDARGLGPAAFVGPTGGYLIGFVAGAFVAGFGRDRRFPAAFGCALLGVLAVYVFGFLGLVGYSGNAERAIMQGILPFILGDFGKAMLAAALVMLGRESRARWFTPLA